MPAASHIPVVHAVTDDATLARAEFTTAAAQVMNALGSRGAVHLRAARLTARAMLAHAERLARMQELTGCWLVVNDRVDVALAARARGAQLTSRSMLAGDARRIAPTLGLGASVHSEADADAATAAGADWLVLGHVFETESHPGAPGRGPGLLASVARRAPVPVIAIGGVTAAQVPLLRREGARGVAAIRGIWNALHAGDAAAGYLSAYDADDGFRAEPGERGAGRGSDRGA
jgi:thiamine-phosphate diphosphorylase